MEGSDTKEYPIEERAARDKGFTRKLTNFIKELISECEGNVLHDGCVAAAATHPPNQPMSKPHRAALIGVRSVWSTHRR